MGLKIAVFAIAGVLFLVLTRKHTQSFGIIGEIAVVTVILLSILPEIKNLIDLMDVFSSSDLVSSSAIKIMFKTFGILTAGAIASDVCRDNGENAIAGVVELGMKILTISCALPVFSAVVEIASAFFNR